MLSISHPIQTFEGVLCQSKPLFRLDSPLSLLFPLRLSEDLLLGHLLKEGGREGGREGEREEGKRRMLKMWWWPSCHQYPHSPPDSVGDGGQCLRFVSSLAPAAGLWAPSLRVYEKGEQTWHMTTAWQQFCWFKPCRSLPILTPLSANVGMNNITFHLFSFVQLTNIGWQGHLLTVLL